MTTTFAPSGRVGPLDDVAIHVALGYYPEGTTVARWDVATWDAAAAVWTGDAPLDEITCDVEEVQILRGRDLPLARFRPGTATVTVEDPTGRLSPWRTVGSGALAYTAIRPGIELRIWAIVGGVRLDRFRGIVDEIDDRFPDTDRHSVTFVALDYLSVLAAFDGLEQSPVGTNETAGPRLTRIATNAAYAFPTRFDVGTVPLQATTLAKNAVDEAGMVADTEMGALFCDTDGTLVFRDRNGLVADPHYVAVQAIFGEVDPEICYAEITLATDLDETKNVVTISRDGGTATTAVDEASRALYQSRTYRRLDLIHADDGESAVIASRILAIYGDATSRIEDFSVVLTTIPDDVGVVLALGLLWRIQIRRRAEGFQVAADLQIQTVEERITPDDWSLRFRTFSAEDFHGSGRWDVAFWDSGLWGY